MAKDYKNEFRACIVRNSFTGSRYCHKDGIEYSRETESESDCSLG